VAPANAPRNGNGGSAPPTSVQPAQPASHQATQVSPAAAQQRPTNGGSPAATQANAKQAANGKEDDEDWWTE
jgi:hypothetical protein